MNATMIIIMVVMIFVCASVLLRSRLSYRSSSSATVSADNDKNNNNAMAWVSGMAMDTSASALVHFIGVTSVYQKFTRFMPSSHCGLHFFPSFYRIQTHTHTNMWDFAWLNIRCVLILNKTKRCGQNTLGLQFSKNIYIVYVHRTSIEMCTCRCFTYIHAHTHRIQE